MCNEPAGLVTEVCNEVCNECPPRLCYQTPRTNSQPNLFTPERATASLRGISETRVLDLHKRAAFPRTRSKLDPMRRFVVLSKVRPFPLASESHDHVVQDLWIDLLTPSKGTFARRTSGRRQEGPNPSKKGTSHFTVTGL